MDARRIEREIFLRTLVVARLSSFASRSLAEAMREEVFAPGAVLYRTGEPSADILFLDRGSVELRAEGAEPWTVHARGAIGIIDALIGRAHARTATALTEVRSLRLPSEDYFEVLEESFDDARNVVIGVSSNLHSIVEATPPDGGFPAPPPAADAPPARALDLVDRMSILRRSVLLRQAGIQALSSLAGATWEARVEAGERVPGVGGASDELVFVAGGEVELRGAEARVRARFGPGSLVGGFGALSRSLGAYDAIACGRTALLGLRIEDLLDVMEQHPQLARRILAGTSLERERLLHVRAERGLSQITTVVAPPGAQPADSLRGRSHKAMSSP
jgi:CRP-like cAMP-binding protein